MEEKLLGFVLYMNKLQSTANVNHILKSEAYLKVKEIVCADSFQPALKTRLVRS